MLREIPLRDGRQWPVHVTGTGRPLLLIHGWAMGCQFFGPQVDALSNQFTLIRADLRSHHADQNVDGPHTIEALAEDVRALMLHLNLQETLIIGWSMGAMVLWSALHQADVRERTAGMISIDMSLRITNDDGWKLGLSDGRRAFETLKAVETMKEDWHGTVTRMVPRIFAPQGTLHHPKLASEMVEHALALPAEKLAALWESMAIQDFWRFLPSLNIPLLAIHGAHSQLYEVATGKYIAEAAPKGQLAIIDQAGHAPHLENPVAFNSHLVRFAEELSATGATSPHIKSVKQ